MYAEVLQPESISSSDLDAFLEKGYFRLGSKLFTTSFLCFEDSLFDAFWLRIDLEEFKLSRSQKELMKRAGRFTIKIAPFLYSYEAEDLFQMYRASVSFTPARTLEHILGEDPGLFNTYGVSIYDGKKFIACGLFDLGTNSAEGIVSFYDPEYKRFSLGKVLMLAKMQFCQESGMRWYYPGYVAPGYAKFDYKLDVGKEYSYFLELKSRHWKHISELELKEQPLSRMLSGLIQVEGLLHSMGYKEFQLKKYRFYDITLDTSYSEYGLLTYPFFIHCFSNSPMEEVIIVFDALREKYQLLLCTKVFQITFPELKKEYYSTFLLKPQYLIFEDEQELNFTFGLNELLGKTSNTENLS
jgi:arginyl-tRNA--protein-N-Asp/Glu arginylyltransferase